MKVHCYHPVGFLYFKNERTIEMSLNIQPIPPSQVADAINKTGESAIKIGQNISHPFAVYLIMAAGISVAVGLILHAVGITKRVLVMGLSMALGTILMLILTGHPLEIVGVALGGIESFFSYLKN
ncbi:MAG: hypothetical protein A4E53_00002 [Pelotomaculum sp. PtaB.Bin104]|nr:MAG: hypothetical protein A4E53_00002 [Pelotomaculum sp. PtaB.Bin104]